MSASQPLATAATVPFADARCGLLGIAGAANDAASADGGEADCDCREAEWMSSFKTVALTTATVTPSAPKTSDRDICGAGAAGSVDAFLGGG